MIASFGRVLGALGAAALSQLHPRMLGLLVLPVAVAILFWILVAWLVWTPLTQWLGQSLLGEGWPAWVVGWVAAAGLGVFAEWLPALIAMLIVVPAGWVTAIAIVAVFAMPLVMRFLASRYYPSLDRRGTGSPWPGLVNLLLAIPLFAIGYVVTLPLWLIPPLALVVPWLWWGWLTARIMRLDSLVEFADQSERTEVQRSRRWEYLGLGLMVGTINLIPPLFLLTPVLGALAFGHYSLAALQSGRRMRGAATLNQGSQG
jgi:hypothetical protein